jgi:hypothetical protein
VKRAEAPSISATIATPLTHPCSPSASGKTGAGLDWWDWGRVGLGRKAVLLDQGAQGFLPGVLAPQLLGLCLDPLNLDQLRFHALLVAEIPSPIEHRQKLSPPRQR